jgi:hypothetical protein
MLKIHLSVDCIAATLSAEKCFFALKVKDVHYPKTYAGLEKRRIEELEAQARELRKLLGGRGDAPAGLLQRD